jgi:5'-nucleotidase
MKRKEFIEKTALGALMISTGGFPFEAIAAGELSKLTILHTNDQHSRVDPFPMDESKNQGLGGMERRLSTINKIRTEEQNVILLDSGDIFQGTPYFNKFLGYVEIEMMNKMKYDAVTIGNHDFDGGLENLKQRINEAKFPFLNANYIFDCSPLKGLKPYSIFKFNDIKVGVFGLGIELDGLVPKKHFGDIVYTDPIAEANKTATILKKDEKCQLVICLSHLGYSYNSKKVSDVLLAEQTKNIDIILGGHTHTFLDTPTEKYNLDGKKVLINQVGWAGIMLGRIDLHFDLKKKKHVSKQNPIKIG